MAPNDFNMGDVHISVPVTPESVKGFTDAELAIATQELQRRIREASATTATLSAKEKQATIPPQFTQLCKKSVEYSASNESAAEQARGLVESGAVTISGDKTNFHTINGKSIGKSILKNTYKLPIDKNALIKKRSMSTDVVGKEHGKDNVWFEQRYLDDPKNVTAIKKNLKSNNQELALYDNVRGPIYNALEGDPYTRWRTIQLLTNINDWMIVDTKSGEDPDYPNSRRFLLFDEGKAGMNTFDNVFNVGSLCVAENCAPGA